MNALQKVINAHRQGKLLAEWQVESDQQVVNNRLAHLELKKLKPRYQVLLGTEREVSHVSHIMQIRMES